MTVLERLKAAGYDPAVSLFPDSIGNAGSMECERIQIRTFFCRPRENEAAIGVTATAMTHFSDGSTRPYPDGWPRSLEASVTLYFAGDADFHYFGAVAILRLVVADDLSSGRAIDGQNEAAAVVLEDYEETKKELADWVNASPEELADVIAGM